MDRRWTWLMTVVAALLPSAVYSQYQMPPNGPIEPSGTYQGPPVFGPSQGPSFQGPGGYPPPQSMRGHGPPQGGYPELYQPQVGGRYLQSWEENEQSLDLAIRETVAQSWLRVDYMHYSIQGLGNRILGAPLLPTPTNLHPDPRVPFLSNDLIPGAPRQQQAGFLINAQVSDTNLIRFDNMNGIRGTIGIPLRTGTFEANAWALHSDQTGFFVPPTIDRVTNEPSIIPAVTLRQAGLLSNTTMLLFSGGLNVQSQVGMRSTEFNWISNPLTPNVPLKMQSVVGMRYIRYMDRMVLSGHDENTVGSGSPATDHVISSKALNDVFGPHFGFRSELEMDRLTLGLEPKIMLGIDRQENRLHTEQLVFPAEAPRDVRGHNTHISPVLDLTAYTRFRLTDGFSVFASYNLLTFASVSRADRNIFYDSPVNPSDTPTLRLQSSNSRMAVYGWTVGGEFRFR